MTHRLHNTCWLLLFLSLPALAALPTHLYYTGIMGGRYPVQMDLAWKGDNSLMGDYRYESTAEPIHLLGNTLAGGVVKIVEFYDLPAAQQVTEGQVDSGAFSGHFSADRRTFTGVWTSKNGKRHLSVLLSAVAEYQTIHQDDPDLTGSSPVFFSPSPALQQLSERLRQQIFSAYNQFRQQLPANRDAQELAKQDYRIVITYYRPDFGELAY